MGTERIPVCSVWARLGAQAPIPVLPHFSAVNDLQAGPAPRTDRYLLATFGARAADTEHEAQAFVVDLLSLHKGLRDADREVGVPRALALCAPDGGVLREHVTESLFSLDGSLAVLGCYSGFVGLYDATRSFALLQHEQLASEVASLSVAAVSDGVLAIGTSQRGSVSLVSLKRAPLSTQTHSLALRANAQECAAWTSAFAIDGSGCDSSALAVGFGGSRGLCVLDSTRLAWSDLRSAAGFEVTRVACCPRSSGFAGAWIWAASQDEMLRVLDSRSGNVVALVDTDCAAFARPTRKALASAPEVLSFEFCPVGQLLCVCKNDGALAVFDSRYLGAPMSVFEHGYENGTRSEACEVVAAWSPTNGFLVSGADDYKTRVFDTRVANRDALVSCIDESLAANGAGCVSALSIALAGDVVAVGGNPGRVVLRYLRV
jgi:WD40 repeat protein